MPKSFAAYSNCGDAYRNIASICACRARNSGRFFAGEIREVVAQIPMIGEIERAAALRNVVCVFDRLGDRCEQFGYGLG